MPAEFELSRIEVRHDEHHYDTQATNYADTPLNKKNRIVHEETVPDKLPQSFVVIIGFCLLAAILASVVFVAYTYEDNASDDASPLSSSICLIIGILNSLVGSLLSASGYCCQKWAHLQVEKKPELGKATSQPVFIIGLLLLATGTISAIVNLGLLGQTVQSPFAALTLIYNALLARSVLREKYETVDLVSSLLIIGGIGVAVYGIEQSNIQRPTYTLDSLLHLYLYDNWLPIAYTLTVLTLIIVSWKCIRKFSLQRSAIGILSFSLSAGFMAGFTSLSVKSFVEIVKGVADHHTNDLTNPITYLFVLFIPASLVPQLYFMNQGLKYFGTLLFVPLYQSFIIIGNLLCGVVYFDELSAYTSSSIILFCLGCFIVVAGIWTLLAKVSATSRNLSSRYSKVFLVEDGIDCERVQFVNDGAVFLSDFEECKQSIVELFSSAKSSIYYSTFLCDFSQELPKHGSNGTHSTTILELIKDAVSRGVKVNILYNPVVDYGTASVKELISILPQEVNLQCSVSDLGPSNFTKNFSGNSRYAFHHQKYLCIDGELGLENSRIMVTGCDVNDERNAWLKENRAGYYWHEVSVVTPCESSMFNWIVWNHHTEKRHLFDNIDDPPPFPIVNGGWREENIMVDMILKATTSIHIENQIFISGGNEQENRVSEAIVERIYRAILNEEDFHVLILTNAAQQDEPSRVTRWYCKLSLDWSLQSLELLASKRGISRTVLYEHILIGRLEHNGILIKVHSNFIIQDGYRCIRSSSNLADRSLSNRQCDAETGILVEGASVEEFQQLMLNRYMGTTNQHYTIKSIVRTVSVVRQKGNMENSKSPTTNSANTCIHPLLSSNFPYLFTRFLMLFFIYASEGATGARYRVTLTNSKGHSDFFVPRIVNRQGKSYYTDLEKTTHEKRNLRKISDENDSIPIIITQN